MLSHFGHILNNVKTSYSKYRKLALWTKAQSLVLFVSASKNGLTGMVKKISQYSNVYTTNYDEWF